MAYITQGDNVIVIDAIITKKGRENMATGKGLNIVKFALSDDEIDYGQWNPNNSQGSEYYGVKIENMPLTEANPDETRNMRYKLVSQEKDNVVVSVIVDTPDQLDFKSNGEQILEPNVSSGNTSFGYTLQIPNGSSLFNVVEIGSINSRTAKTISITGKSTTITAVGEKFKLIAKPQTVDKNILASIIDNASGATKDIRLTITKLEVGPKGNLF